ncbi:TWiK family of potassium channels protein 7-like [Saccostrea cucullata]|uniref:TWiK family of potassium channels protein 7-like n=1 Tax=Saccostrea cuccullata TaxID=36930 RepID=UPI002ED1AA60
MAGSSDEKEQKLSTDEERDEVDEHSDEINDDVISVKFNNGGQHTFGEEAISVVVSDEKPNSTKEKGQRRCCFCCINCLRRCKRQDENKESKTDSKTKRQTSQVRNLSKSEQRKERCWVCCKKFTAFLFSHIGLCGLVIAYSIMGGFVFMSLEASHEIMERGSVDMRRKSQIERLWNITNFNLILGKKNWTYEVDKVLRDFQTDIYEATKLRGWDGQGEDADAQWSFANSLLYSITVITTIGYGHIAPKTDMGKFITIVYALVGIPITLLCLANLGGFLGNCFRWFYKHVCLLTIWLCCPSQAKWSSERKRDRDMNKTLDKTHQPKTLTKRKWSQDSIEKGQLIGNNDVIEMVVTEKGPKEQVRVPIFVSLMLITLYIFGGAILFSEWENWPWLDGAYFCFITLSTIGFGDLVPGMRSDSPANQEKLILCAFYLIFGLAIIAMCFDLMQEEVRAKCRWLGQKLGLIETED